MYAQSSKINLNSSKINILSLGPKLNAIVKFILSISLTMNFAIHFETFNLQKKFYVFSATYSVAEDEVTFI